jgi:hypothetical protein
LYFIETFKFYIGGNELPLDLSNNVKIRTKIASFLSSNYDLNELPVALSALRNAGTTTMSTLLTVGTTASTTYYISLLPLLEFLYEVNISDLGEFKIEMTFRSNTTTAGDLCQFIQSSTSANVYSSITFTNMYLQLYCFESDNDTLFRPLRNSSILVKKYCLQTTSCSWASGSETLRIRINNDFPHYNYVGGVYLYAFNNGACTTMDDADAMKFSSAIASFNVTMTENNKNILELDASTKKALYKYNTSMLINNRPPNYDMYDTTTFHLYYCPFLKINFNLIHNTQADDGLVIVQGLNNGDTDMELNITNVSALSATTSFYAVLEYYQLYRFGNGGFSLY